MMPGMRPRLATGLRSTSLMATVKSMEAGTADGAVHAEGAHQGEGVATRLRLVAGLSRRVNRFPSAAG